jgi:hypothetical protein
MHRYLSIGLLVSLSACSPADDTVVPGPPMGDAGTDLSEASADTANGDVDAAREVCNSLSLDGVSAAPMRGTSDKAPSPTGGVVSDGTYVLSEVVAYELPTIPQIPFLRVKWVITGNKLQGIDGDPEPGSVNPDHTSTNTLSFSGSTLTIAQTCPITTEPAATVAFSVVSNSGLDATTGTTLTLYVVDHGKTVGETFIRQ